MDNATSDVTYNDDKSDHMLLLKDRHRKNFNGRAFGIQEFISSNQSEIQELERTGEFQKDIKNSQMITKDRYNDILNIMKVWETSDNIFIKKQRSI